MKKKILFIHHGIGIGGAAVSLVSLIKELNLHDKYKIKVIFLKNSDAIQFIQDNKIDFEILSSFFFKKIYRYFSHTCPNHIKAYQIGRIFLTAISWILASFFFIPQILRRENPYLVHLNSSVLSDWVMGCKKLEIKSIIHIREPIYEGKFGIRKKILKKIYNKADHIIAISKDNAERIGLPIKTTVIYNFVEERFFNNFKNSSIKNKDFINVLYMGGYSYNKGFQIITKALELLSSNIRVYFAGYFPTNKIKKSKILLWKLFPVKREKYNCLVKMRKARNAVEIGKVYDIFPVLLEADIIVFPAIVEHFARPIIEGFSLGIPAVATNIAGMNEIVEHGLTGFLFDKNNHIHLSLFINMLAADPELLKKMGRNCFEKAKVNFSNANVIAVENIYNNLMEYDKVK